ncbi:PDR/VanB family oxidoreductase [Rhodococcus pyridinivorans]|uniref:PDR/VanB family oxidoreductase n=1 Tax=Rhodococcus pyridinivorans TaxID=103816 RepID=UPI001906B82F|nr:PDR/VanB family oxidoreductase [Rhodococcus pyridinivorans]QQM52976.1 oxidoreductase [Rhodococcus pyridinivorans]UVT23636.1 PDR/VanB family oxidoreductase [Rhodococcus pyridinivorans]
MSASPAPSGALADSALRVTAKEAVSEGVVALTLRHPDNRRLPDWAPGAHIDLVLPSGATRQYSLCGDRWDAYSFRVGVLREPDGRGGSAFIHDTLAVGDLLGVGGPRNNFPLAPAPKYLFIAGGIGITPLIPMIAQADMMGIDWQLLYGGRTRSSMAFLDELSRYGDRVVVAPQDECGLLDLQTWLTAAAATEAKVYVCGPEPLLNAVEMCCVDWPVGKLRMERFVPKEQGAPVRDEPFDVELARSGLTVTVTPDVSVLDAVQDAGVNVLSSCGEGTCGTCETPVLAGAPDHRDSILDDDERSAGECMFICVSRACSDRLVLDL